MNVFIKRKNKADQVIRVSPDLTSTDAVLVFNLYTAFEEDHWGRILFDDHGYWIYDGQTLTVTEEEQVAKFIQEHMEVLWSS